MSGSIAHNNGYKYGFAYYTGVMGIVSIWFDSGLNDREPDTLFEFRYQGIIYEISYNREFTDRGLMKISAAFIKRVIQETH
ncbi:MAG: hypothetical protein KA954_01205 [Chitinophagales bacterium]|nr:hypothetical protein [Chitinophagales bacterium]MBP9845850.1 hypothetical protein [Saprospiraceae bacterium]